jgi:hypothetical protein
MRRCASNREDFMRLCWEYSSQTTAHCATKLTNCSFLSGQIETILPLLLLCFTECEMGHPNQIPLEHCPAFGSYTQTGTLLQNKGFTVGVPMKAGCCKTFKTDRFSKPVRPLTLSGNSLPFYWLALTCPSPPEAGMHKAPR